MDTKFRFPQTEVVDLRNPPRSLLDKELEAVLFEQARQNAERIERQIGTKLAAIVREAVEIARETDRRPEDIVEDAMDRMRAEFGSIILVERR